MYYNKIISMIDNISNVRTLDNNGPGSSLIYEVSLKINPKHGIIFKLRADYDVIFFDNIEVEDLSYFERKSIYYRLAVIYEAQKEKDKKATLGYILEHKETEDE